MRALLKAIVAASMMLTTWAVFILPAAAQISYPGVDPELSVEFRGLDFIVRVDAPGNFPLQCGSSAVLPTVTDSMGNVIHTASTPLTGTNTFPWRSAVQAALLAAGVEAGDDITVSFGPGCNSYTMTVINGTSGLSIDSMLSIAMDTPANFGCGAPGFIGVFGVNFFNADGVLIASSAAGADEDSEIPAMLAAWSMALQNAVPGPQPTPGETIRVDWTGMTECPGGGQFVTIGPEFLSDAPVDSSSLTRPALALAALALTTAAVLGRRRRQASRP